MISKDEQNNYPFLKWPSINEQTVLKSNNSQVKNQKKKKKFTFDQMPKQKTKLGWQKQTPQISDKTIINNENQRIQNYNNYIYGTAIFSKIKPNYPFINNSNVNDNFKSIKYCPVIDKYQNYDKNDNNNSIVDKKKKRKNGLPSLPEQKIKRKIANDIKGSDESKIKKITKEEKIPSSFIDNDKNEKLFIKDKKEKSGFLKEKTKIKIDCEKIKLEKQENFVKNVISDNDKNIKPPSAKKIDVEKINKNDNENLVVTVPKKDIKIFLKNKKDSDNSTKNTDVLKKNKIYIDKESEKIIEKYEKNNIDDANFNENSDVKKIVNSRIGLENLGNTCFMNTCLQNLIHSEYFISLLIKKKKLINTKATISKKFLEICEELIYNKSRSYCPSAFKYAFGSKHSMFRGYSQQDTQEFCRVLLEDMNSELNEIKKPAPYKELTTKGKSKIECDKEFDDFFRKRENSLIMDSFYGQLINIFICECGYETYSFQKILDLPLLLNKSGKVGIKELLDDYFKGEKIKFESKCENCFKKEIHKKKIKFSQPPNILILSLQRSNGRFLSKNTSPVFFPEYLDIRDYIDEECGHGNDFFYCLYGIGNHSGSLDFGHYYAYIKLNDKDWYEYNDSSVYPLSSINNCSSSAYVLFYKLKKK